MQFETSETGHTPGPWYADFEAAGHHVPIIKYDAGTDSLGTRYDYVVASVRYGTDPEPSANARLIAAAPAMFEALRTLIHSLEWEAKRSGTTYHGFEDAKAALALAQGKPGRDPNCDTSLDRDARNMDALHNRPEEL